MVDPNLLSKSMIVIFSFYFTLYLLSFLEVESAYLNVRTTDKNSNNSGNQMTQHTSQASRNKDENENIVLEELEVEVELENNMPGKMDRNKATNSVPVPSSWYYNIGNYYPPLAPQPKKKMPERTLWNCAWQVTTDPAMSTFGLLDFNAFYHTFVFNDRLSNYKSDDSFDMEEEESDSHKYRHQNKIVLSEIKIYRITGCYPLMRYFSFQVYGSDGLIIDNLIDNEISPIDGSGKNPYSDISASMETVGSYEIYLTPTGNFGFPNELKFSNHHMQNMFPNQENPEENIIYLDNDIDNNIDNDFDNNIDVAYSYEASRKEKNGSDIIDDNENENNTDNINDTTDELTQPVRRRTTATKKGAKAKIRTAATAGTTGATASRGPSAITTIGREGRYATVSERSFSNINITNNNNFKRTRQQLFNPTAIVMRLYDQDLSQDSNFDSGINLSKEKLWGFQDPPKIEETSVNGVLDQNQSVDDIKAMILLGEVEWKEVPICTDYQQSQTQATFADMYFLLRRNPVNYQDCPMATMTEYRSSSTPPLSMANGLFNTMIPWDTGLEQSYAALITSFVNFDSDYLYWCSLLDNVTHPLQVNSSTSTEEVVNLFEQSNATVKESQGQVKVSFDDGRDNATNLANAQGHPLSSSGGNFSNMKSKKTNRFLRPLYGSESFSSLELVDEKATNDTDPIDYQFVFVMNGNLPKVPRGLFEDPRVADKDTYDIRYLSVSTVDMHFPSPTLDNLKDENFAALYKSIWNSNDNSGDLNYTNNSTNYNNDEEEGKKNRNYEIVMALNSSVARTCGFLQRSQDQSQSQDQHQAMHIDNRRSVFMRFSVDGLNKPRVPAFIYRQILPTPSHYARSIASVQKSCSESNLNCVRKEYIQEKMQQYYPDINIYSCAINTRTQTAIKINLTN